MTIQTLQGSLADITHYTREIDNWFDLVLNHCAVLTRFGCEMLAPHEREYNKELLRTIGLLLQIRRYAYYINCEAEWLIDVAKIEEES